MYGELKRAIHLDFHTMPGIYNFNEKFDAVKFAERLEKAHVRYINVFAECNQGYAYYDTKIGVKYPTMKGDMFGDILRECHKRDIGVTAYFNLGIDHEACRLHRDWMKVSRDGRVLGEGLSGPGGRGPCLGTGYGDYQYGMIKELIELYPEVDGIFLDCIQVAPCYGNECLEAVKAAGGDPTNPSDVSRYYYDLTMNFLKRVKKLIGDRNLYGNSIPEWAMREIDTHVEIECLPGTYVWNFDYFTVNAAYARRIKDKVIYMSGRFQSSWGDFGGLKTCDSLENDMLDALMNGVECSVGDHMHPAGNLDENVYDTVERIYEKIMAYEPWTDGAKYKAEVGILCSLTSGRFKDGPYQGLSRMLGEMKLTFDVVNETMDFTKYKLLIIPDTLRLTPVLCEKVAAHIALGKPVLSSGQGGLAEGENSFALPQWDFTFEGIDTSAQAFYKYADDSFRYAVYVPGILMHAGENAEVIAEYYKPYFNKGWDGFHSNRYMPPEKATGHAMAAVSGRVAHIAFNVFTVYNQSAYIAHKKLVKKCLDAIGFEPTVTTDLPSTARVTLTETYENILLHIKVDFAEVRGESVTIEEHTRYPSGAVIKINGSFDGAAILPTEEKADAVFEDNSVSITLPEINGYVCIALHKA